MARFRGTGTPATPGATPLPAVPLPAGNPVVEASGLKDVLSGITASLQSFKTAATQAAAGLVAFKAVSLAAPGTMQRFNLALQDSTAVIGQRLAPVFEQVLIPVIRLFGDFLTTILPSADDFAAMLTPVVEFLDELRKALAAVAPLIKEVLIVGLRALGEALRLVLWPFRVLFQFLQEVFGLEGKAKLGSSVGAAARSIRFEDPMSAARSVYQAAFQARGGTEAGQKKTPLDDINNSVQQAVQWLKKIFGEDSIIGQVLRTISKVVEAIFSVLPKPQEIIDAISEATKHSPEEFWDAIIHAPGSPFGSDPNRNAPGPRDPDRAQAQDLYARAFGEGTRKAQAVSVLPFGRELVGESVLKELIAALRKLGEQGGVKRVQDDIDSLLDQAKRRGMDGHPGGA